MENIRKQSFKAYLLLESLITMALLSILVTVVLSALTKSKQEDEAINRQIFCQQIRAELGQAKLVKVEQNYLFVSTDKLVGEDFRKTDANGRGYQPMLYGIKKVEMSQQGQTVSLVLNFEQGGRRTFIYTFLEATE